MGQPETPQEYKHRYGVWPPGHEPEEEAPAFIAREGEILQLFVHTGALILCSKGMKRVVPYDKVVEIIPEGRDQAIRITYKRYWGIKRTQAFYCKNEIDFQRCVRLLDERAKGHITS